MPIIVVAQARLIRGIVGMVENVTVLSLFKVITLTCSKDCDTVSFLYLELGCVLDVVSFHCFSTGEKFKLFLNENRHWPGKRIGQHEGDLDSLCVKTVTKSRPQTVTILIHEDCPILIYISTSNHSKISKTLI